MSTWTAAASGGWLKKLGKFRWATPCTSSCAAPTPFSTHELGLVHRDIKPENVLLDQQGRGQGGPTGPGQADRRRQLDAPHRHGRRHALVHGPEQPRCKRVDAAATSTPWAACWYTFLAGKPPFQARRCLELIEAKEKEKHTPAAG